MTTGSRTRPVLRGENRELARAASARIRRVRHGSLEPATLSTWYMTAIAVATATAFTVGTAQWLLVDDCTSALCQNPSLRPPWALALTAIGLGATSWALTVLGPVSASRARLSWVLSGPADRSYLLRRHAATVGLLTTVLGALLGAGVGLVASSPAGSALPTTLLSSAAYGGLVGLLLFTAAFRLQVDDGVPASNRTRLRWFTRAGICLLLGGSAALVLLSAPLRGVHDLVVGAGEPPARPVLGVDPVLLLPAAAVVVILVVLPALTVRRPLARVGSWALRQGDAVLEAALASLLMLESTAASTLAETRRAVARSRFTSRRGRRPGPVALVERDLLRLTRTWAPALSAVLTLAVLAAAGGSSGRTGLLLLAGLLATLVASSAGVSLRTWSRSAALQRDLPLSATGVRLALLVAPTLVTGIWSVVAVGLVQLPLWQAAAVTAAGLAALMSSAAPRSEVGAGALLATPAGPLPLGVVRQVLLTPAVALLVVAPVALTGHLLALLVPAVVLVRQVRRA